MTSTVPLDFRTPKTPRLMEIAQYWYQLTLNVSLEYLVHPVAFILLVYRYMRKIKPEELKLADWTKSMFGQYPCGPLLPYLDILFNCVCRAPGSSFICNWPGLGRYRAFPARASSIFGVAHTMHTYNI